MERLRFVSQTSLLALCFLLVAIVTSSCGDDKESVEIRDVRERSTQGHPPMHAAGAHARFGLSNDPHAPSDPHAGIPGFPSRMRRSGITQSKFGWTAPTGWEALPPEPMRDASFRVGGHQQAKCTLSSAGGALLANVNRWRGQMGLEPTDEASLAALPRRTVLGEESVVVELEGDFKGMGGSATPSAKMLAIVIPQESMSLFVKMTGPADVVEGEREKFFAFAESLRKVAPAATPATASPPKPTIAWDAPKTWKQLPSSPPRIATFRPEGAKTAQCLITGLVGTGGGVRANIDEWRRQMGQKPLSDEDFKNLKRIPVLGVDATFASVTGNYRGKSGETAGNATLYGLIAPKKGMTLFVKMWGPTSELKDEEENFLAFCRSLRE